MDSAKNYCQEKLMPRIVEVSRTASVAIAIAGACRMHSFAADRS